MTMLRREVTKGPQAIELYKASHCTGGEQDLGFRRQHKPASPRLMPGVCFTLLRGVVPPSVAALSL